MTGPVVLPRSIEETLAALAGGTGRHDPRGRHRPDGRGQRGHAPAGVGRVAGRRCPSCAAGAATATTWCSAPALTYTEMEHGELAALVPGAVPGRPHRRLAADPQRRRRSAATSAPRRRPATRCRCWPRSTPSSRSADRPAPASLPVLEFVTGREEDGAGAGRAGDGRAAAGAARPAGVPQGRHPQRHGHQRGDGRPRRRPRRAHRAARAGLGRPGAGARPGGRGLRRRAGRLGRRRRCPVADASAFARFGELAADRDRTDRRPPLHRRLPPARRRRVRRAAPLEEGAVT